VKCLRSDKGGEYWSNEFFHFCKENGIRRHLTSPYTPQQNGVAERKNRTLVEMERSMMQSKKLPNIYWDESIRIAVYILNRYPTRRLDKITPYEAWFERKPSLEHMRVFGCLAYVHINDEKRRKLDAKSKSCVFIGYCEHSKAYKFYNPKSQKIILLIDAIFDEGGEYSNKKL